MPISFTWFDGVLLGIIVLSLFMGMIKGLLREVVSLVSLFLSVFLAFKFAEPLGQYFTWWQSASLKYVVAFVVIALVVIIAGILIGIMLKHVAKDIGLGGLDHGLGAIFGFLRGSVISVIIVFLLSNTAVAESHWFKKSLLQTFFHSSVEWLDTFSPQDIRQRPEVKKLKKHQSSAMIHRLFKHARKHVNYIKHI